MTNPQEHWSASQRPLTQPFKYVKPHSFEITRDLVLATNSPTNKLLAVNKVTPLCYHPQQHLKQVCLHSVSIFLICMTFVVFNTNFQELNRTTRCLIFQVWEMVLATHNLDTRLLFHPLTPRVNLFL